MDTDKQKEQKSAYILTKDWNLIEYKEKTLH